MVEESKTEQDESTLQSIKEENHIAPDVSISQPVASGSQPLPVLTTAELGDKYQRISNAALEMAQQVMRVNDAIAGDISHLYENSNQEEL